MMRYEKHGYATKGVAAIYHRWHRMIRRCHDTKCDDYKDYGGRGISVCKEWRDSLSNFISDMGMPENGMTIERIDNERGYFKENCRWATQKEQRANQRLPKNTIYLTYEDKTQTLAAWAVERGIKYITLYARIHHYNQSVEKALGYAGV